MMSIFGYLCGVLYTIVLSVLRCAASGCPFDIFKLFFPQIIVKEIFRLYSDLYAHYEIISSLIIISEEISSNCTYISSITIQFNYARKLLTKVNVCNKLKSRCILWCMCESLETIALHLKIFRHHMRIN
jgi:hypothetical protein